MTITDIKEYYSTGKKLLAILVGLSVPALAYAKSDEIMDMVGGLGGRLKTAEIPGLKLEFSEPAIEKSVRPDLFRHLDAKARRAIAADLAAFEPRTAVRLLSVGLLENTCDFDTPTHEMAQDYAADVFLREKKLAVLLPDEAARDAVLRETIQREEKTHKKSDIGYPRNCYKVRLTDRGIDVRTAMIHLFGATFGPTAGEGEQVADKRAQDKRAQDKIREARR